MTIDVSEASTTERPGQIEYAKGAAERARSREATYQERFDGRLADGTLKDLGGGRYQVTDPGSFDDGEVLLRRFSERGEAVILPEEHGLDETGGKVALYSAVPAWHGLGNVIPGGVSDVDEVLRLSGLDYEVLQFPAEYTLPSGARRQVILAGQDKPAAFVNVRGDTMDPLAVVGKIYTPIQAREAFGFLQQLTGKGDVLWESAGAVKNGARVFISLRLPDTLVIDPGGISDTIIPFIVAIDDRTGTSKFQVVATPWRPVCGNTERFAARDARARWEVPHTTNVLKQMEEARRTLGLSLKYFGKLEEEETILARMEAGMPELIKVANELWVPDPQATDRQRTAAQRRLDALAAGFEEEKGKLGSTRYAIERSFTHYLDHVTLRPAPDEPTRQIRRATHALLGYEDKLKSAAHKMLLALPA